jgi:mono/diheme cytochrome c family protein
MPAGTARRTLTKLLRSTVPRPRVVIPVAVALAAFLAVASSPATAPGALAQDTPTTTTGEADDQQAEQLALGSAVFARTCTSCHQAGGVGIVGQFPPLRDNPNVTDPAYVEQVVRGGRQGEIEVNGETYDGLMPAVGADLTDEEISAVAAFVAANLALPGGAEATAPGAATLPGPPGVSVALVGLGFGLALVVAAIVLAPLVLARTDRLHLSWVEASLKTVVIVGYFVVAVVLVPARVMELGPMQDLTADVQYVIGSAVWGGGLLVGLAGLWWAFRRGML